MKEGKSPYSHYLIAFVVIILGLLAFSLADGSYVVAGKAGSGGFDFSVSVSPSSGNVQQGSNITSATTVTLLSGKPKTVTLSQTGCPPSATCSFTPASGLPTYTSTFMATTTSSTPVGTYIITISGTSSSPRLVRTTTYTLTVSPPCNRTNPSVLISPSVQEGTAGTTLTYTTTVTNRDSSACGNSTFDMTYSIPVGWVASFDPTSLSIGPDASRTTTFRITSSSSASPADYTFTNKATNRAFTSYQGSGSAVYRIPTPVNTTGCGSLASCQTVCSSGYYCSGASPNACGGICVQNQTNQTNQSTFDFNVSTSPTSGSVTQGGSATSTTTVALLNGPTENVALSQTGCPASSTCTFTPSSGNPTYTSTFRVATTSSTPTGTYPITIRGTSATKTKTATYTLTVTANQTNTTCTRANPSVSISPSIKSGTPGQQLNYTTTVTNRDSSACGNSTFDMTYSIPSGWGAFFNPTSLLIGPGASKTTTFFITSSTNSTQGNYTFTNTATNRGAPSFQGSGSAVYRVI